MVSSFIATLALLPASTELFHFLLIWWDLHNQDLEKMVKIKKLPCSSIVHLRMEIFQWKRLKVSTTENQPSSFTTSERNFPNWKQCSPIWDENVHHQDSHIYPGWASAWSIRGIQEWATAANYSKGTLCEYLALGARRWHYQIVI